MQTEIPTIDGYRAAPYRNEDGSHLKQRKSLMDKTLKSKKGF